MAVELRTSDGIAVVTLNRPEKLNSVTLQMRADLRQVWRDIDNDDAVRVAVLIGAGDRAFCTGADLQEAGEQNESFAADTFGRTSQDLLSPMLIDKPIVCAINGYAVGGGLEMALGCDIRIAAEHAQFGLTEVRIGTMPGSGGTQTLPRIVGRSMAMQMLLTGDRIDAATALRCGLVSELVEAATLQGRAMEIAGRIAANAPLSVRAVKRSVLRGVEVPLTAALDMERYAFGLLRATEDRDEGREAFRQKRTPQFRGR